MDYMNRKGLKLNDLVYFVNETNGYHAIKFGLVDVVVGGICWIDELTLKYFDETVNGIPVEVFQSPSEWMALPKKWEGRPCDLLDWNQGHIAPEIEGLSPVDADGIMEAYRNGYLVRASEYGRHKFDIELDNRKGWRIVRKDRRAEPHYSQTYQPLHYTVRVDECYSTYTEAQGAVNADRARIERIQKMTDAELSIEEINQTLDRWRRVYEIADDEYRHVKKMILSLPTIEDVEVCIRAGAIKWKHWKSRGWKGLEDCAMQLYIATPFWQRETGR